MLWQNGFQMWRTSNALAHDGEADLAANAKTRLDKVERNVEAHRLAEADAVLVDDLEPLVHEGQRRRAKEHVADVEGRVDRLVRLEATVDRRVG